MTASQPTSDGQEFILECDGGQQIIIKSPDFRVHSIGDQQQNELLPIRINLKLWSPGVVDPFLTLLNLGDEITGLHPRTLPVLLVMGMHLNECGLDMEIPELIKILQEDEALDIQQVHFAGDSADPVTQ